MDQRLLSLGHCNMVVKGSGTGAVDASRLLDFAVFIDKYATLGYLLFRTIIGLDNDGKRSLELMEDS